MTPTAVMISHSRRDPRVRERSLYELSKVGIDPIIVFSDAEPPSDREVKRQAWRALAHGELNPDGVLFFEDDILVDEHRMLWFLTGGVPLEYDFVALCLLRLSLYPPNEREEAVARRPTVTRIAPINRTAFSADRGFHGTMGVWLSHTLVQRALEARDEFMSPDGGPLADPVTPSEHARGKVCGFDFWLKDRVRSPGVLFPNAIQHQPNTYSTIAQVVRTIQSSAFGLPFEDTM